MESKELNSVLCDMLFAQPSCCRRLTTSLSFSSEMKNTPSNMLRDLWERKQAAIVEHQFHSNNKSERSEEKAN